MINNEVLKIYEWMLANSPKLASKDAYQIMQWANENGYVAIMLWKIPEVNYRKWYNKWIKANKDIETPTTLSQETVYIVSSENKAFDYQMGGYSIFAQSIGAKIRNSKEIERIETMNCEYAILVYLERKEAYEKDNNN